MKPIIEKIPFIARVLLGLMFVVFGLNGLLNFIPMEPPSGAAGQFMGGLAASGYFFPLLKTTEIAVGLLLLTGCWVPLALVLLAPVTVNIFAFHLFLAPAGLPMTIIIGALQLYLAWSYRSSFTSILTRHAKPTPIDSSQPVQRKVGVLT